MPAIYNPFQMDRPAIGDDFVGRQEEIQELLQNQRNSIVFGYSRMGKTSLLMAILDSLKGNTNINTVYIGESRDSPQDLLGTLRTRLGYENKDAQISIENVENLESALLNLDKFYQEHGNKLFLLLDETERLFAKEDAVRQFRTYNQELSNIVFVYSIFPHVFELMQKLTSRFQDTVNMVPLTPFTIKETRELIEISADSDRMYKIAESQGLLQSYSFESFRIEEDLPAIVLELTGGFPYLIQGLMRKGVDYSLKETSDKTILTKEKVDAVYELFLEDIKEQIAHLWNSLSPLQRRILALITQQEGIEENELVQRTAELHNQNPSMFYGAVNPLSGKGTGLVMKRDKSYFIRGKIIKDSMRYFVNLFLVDKGE